MTSNNYKRKATGHATSLANGHFTGSEVPFVCEIPAASSNKKRCNFADTGLAVGTPADFASTKECFKRSLWFGKRHKTDAFTKLGNLQSELHVPHRQCLAGIISKSVSVSFSSIWPSYPRFYCSPNKACATPAGTYRVQYLDFLVY